MTHKTSDRLLRLLSAFVIAVFVNFVFANTVFMHSHVTDDGLRVCHSHPYIPSAQGHSHSACANSAIAQFNAATAAMSASWGVALPQVSVTATAVVYEPAELCVQTAHALCIDTRGPPVESIF